jgi:hypothetical protein
MFHLSFDAEHRVLLSSFSGTYAPDDITLRDGAVRRFVAANGLVNGIMDFSAVDRISVSMDLLIERSHQPPILRGRKRVIVAPDEPALAFNRLVAAHQLYARKEEPALVRSMREACGILGVLTPRFVPLPPDAASRRERVLHRAIQELGRITTDDAWSSFGPIFGRLVGRSPLRSKNITLSDLVNGELRRSALQDADIRAYCPSCRQALILADCPIVAGRTTLYLCPTCQEWVVRMAFLGWSNVSAGEGYVIGQFDVMARADLHLAGVRLPRPGADRPRWPNSSRRTSG